MHGSPGTRDEYPNQSPTTHHDAGTGRHASLISRLADDGSTITWRRTYNAQGYVTSTTGPLGRQTSYSYAGNGRDLLEVRQTSPGINHLLASFGNYTATHRPQTITDAAGDTTTLTYNAHGQVLTVTNAKSETTTYAYDSTGDGYLLSVTGPATGATTALTYDGYGRPRTVTGPDGYTVTLDYDAFDRLTKVTYPDGTVDETTYDRLHVSQRRDRLGRISRLFVDAAQRPTGVRDPLGRTTQLLWRDGALAALVDAKQHKTAWTRDRPTRRTR